MANWNKIAGTALDVGLMFTPLAAAQGISYATTGQSVGSNVTGEESAVDKYAGGLPSMLSGGGKSGTELEQFQNQQAFEQQRQAEIIKKELETQGRPQMDAEAARRREIADLAAQYAQEGMPEAQRQLASDEIARTQQAQLSAMSGLGAGLRGLGNTQASTASAYRNLAAQDAAIAQANQAQYLGALGGLAGAEAGAEYYNELLPYEQKQAEMQALQGSGLQNQYGAYNFAYQQQMNQQQAAMNLLGSGLGAAGQAAMASDVRLKENITHTGHSESGIPTYTWNYKGTPANQRYSGTMAQDLIKLGHSHAVKVVDGYYAVDYSQIDVEFKQID